jgi:hypothetical protein
MGKNEVQQEDGSQERTGAGEDKSSAAASVNFVEKPYKLKHDKPDYYLRGFNSQLELDGFYQALLELGKQKARCARLWGGLITSSRTLMLGDCANTSMSIVGVNPWGCARSRNGKWLQVRFTHDSYVF